MASNCVGCEPRKKQQATDCLCASSGVLIKATDRDTVSAELKYVDEALNRLFDSIEQITQRLVLYLTPEESSCIAEGYKDGSTTSPMTDALSVIGHKVRLATARIDGLQGRIDA